MLKLIIGRAGAGKTTAVLERLCAAGAARPQLLIVPEPQSHETERALCQLGGNTVSLFAEVLSFRRLGDRVLSELGGVALPELDGGGRVLLMHTAVKQASPALKVYARPSRRPAFLRSLLATADELTSCAVPPEELLRVGEELSGEDGDKLRDLGLILSAYHGLTAQTALDPRERLTRVADKLKGSGWAAGKDVWLDGFTDFTPQEREVLRWLMTQGHSLTVTLTCDALDGEDDVFSAARRTAQQLLRMARECGVPAEAEHLSLGKGKAEPLTFLEQNLFAPIPQTCVSCGGAVELFSAQSPRSEVEWAASRIRELVRSGAYRFRDVGVAARCYEDYRDLVETVFPRYGVPVFSSAMSDILDRPVLSLVTAALDTVAGGYAYDDLFGYLKTGLTDLEQSDRDLLENYALIWNLRGSQWTGSRDWTLHPRGYGFPLKQSDRAMLDKLNTLRRQVVAPLEKLRKNTCKTGKGQAYSLYSFLEEIGLPTRLDERVEELRRRGEPTLAEEYRQLWEILCGALDQCAALLGDAPMELEEFSELFRLVLSQYDVGVIPVSLDRVTAGETTRQTGHRVKALFLLGADDASLPRVGETAGLLSDDDRSLLASMGLEVGQTGRELLSREMTTIYQTCARPSERLFVTWPAVGSGGEERRASFLVERLRLLFDDLKPLREEDLQGSFRRTAPLPALEQAGRDEALREALSALPEYADDVERLRRAARWERGKLSRQAVKRLYGSRVSMSASRMDKYKSCHFSYFMRYGLRAKPRRSAGFTAPEYGTFVHYVLEHVVQEGGDELNGAWDDGAKARVHALTKQVVERYVAEKLGGLEEQTDRFRYLFRRLLRPVQGVVDNVFEELAHSQFRPISFELGFARNGKVPSVKFTVDGVTLSISGFVDRVDGWTHDGKLFLRVVDYKTGRKSFDLTEVWNGLGLQMLLYLFTLERKGETLYNQPVEGAGVLYLPARDVVLKGTRAMDESAWRKALDRELTRSGLVLDDPAVLSAMERPDEGGYRFLPLKLSKDAAITGEALASAERLGRLGKHIQGVLGEICRELAEGNIAADPFWRGEDKNACKFCDYAAACQFEEGRGGDCRRWLPKLKVDEFWARVEGQEPSETP